MIHGMQAMLLLGVFQSALSSFPTLGTGSRANNWQYHMKS